MCFVAPHYYEPACPIPEHKKYCGVVLQCQEKRWKLDSSGRILFCRNPRTLPKAFENPAADIRGLRCPACTHFLVDLNWVPTEKRLLKFAKGLPVCQPIREPIAELAGHWDSFPAEMATAQNVADLAGVWDTFPVEMPTERPAAELEGLSRDARVAEIEISAEVGEALQIQGNRGRRWSF